MSGWNIRVVRHVCKRWNNSFEVANGSGGFELQEVFYGLGNTKRLDDYHHGGVCLSGDTVDELAQTAHRIWRATSMSQAGQLDVLDCKCDAMAQEATAA